MFYNVREKLQDVVNPFECWETEKAEYAVIDLLVDMGVDEDDIEIGFDIDETGEYATHMEISFIVESENTRYIEWVWLG